MVWSGALCRRGAGWRAGAAGGGWRVVAVGGCGGRVPVVFSGASTVTLFWALVHVHSLVTEL